MSPSQGSKMVGLTTTAAFLFMMYMSSTSMIMSTEAFSPQAYVHVNNHPLSSASLSSSSRTSTSTSLQMAKRKGFGKQTKKTTPPKSSTITAPEPVTTTSTNDNDNTIESPLSQTAGADALARLRKQKVEERNDELRSMRELRNIDQQLTQNPGAATIPEPVAQRMGKRMLPFVGIPLFGGMGAFLVFWYLATYKNYEFQPALVAFTTIAILAVGLLGITYSVMSASWDETEEGSALGVDEFKKNFGSIQDGLKRTKNNAILRDKMSSVSEQEMEAALRDLDRKEKAGEAKKLTLEQKLQKDLE